MFEIKELTNEQVGEFFINDPQLAYLGLSDEFLVGLYQDRVFDAGDLTTMKGVYSGDELVMIFKYEQFAQVTLNTHYYLKTSLQSTDMFSKIVDFLHRWVKETYPYITKILTMSPSTCIHVPPIVKKYGFVQEGCITNAIVWRKKIVDILIFGKPLEDVK